MLESIIDELVVSLLSFQFLQVLIVHGFTLLLKFLVDESVCVVCRQEDQGVLLHLDLLAGTYCVTVNTIQFAKFLHGRVIACCYF